MSAARVALTAAFEPVAGALVAGVSRAGTFFPANQGCNRAGPTERCSRKFSQTADLLILAKPVNIARKLSKIAGLKLDISDSGITLRRLTPDV